MPYHYHYDRDSFLAGLAAGRALWQPPEPPVGLASIVKQLFITVPYTLTWNGPRSFTLEWTTPRIYKGVNSVVLQPWITRATITGGGGARWQYGTCNANGSMPGIIETGANRVSYTNSRGDFSAAVSKTGTNCIFCGEVFPTPGDTRSLTVTV